MRVNPQAANVRLCQCADCRRPLEKGQGVRYSYDMFGGRGAFYYCCPECDSKREQHRIEREKAASAKQAAIMDREARAQGVDYE